MYRFQNTFKQNPFFVCVPFPFRKGKKLLKLYVGLYLFNPRCITDRSSAVLLLYFKTVMFLFCPRLCLPMTFSLVCFRLAWWSPLWERDIHVALRTRFFFGVSVSFPFDVCNLILSYDVAIIQLLTSCHKIV